MTGSRTTCKTPFVGCDALLLIVTVSVAVRARGLITVYSRWAKAVEDAPRRQKQSRKRLEITRLFDVGVKSELGDSDSTGMIQTQLNGAATSHFLRSESQCNQRICSAD